MFLKNCSIISINEYHVLSSTKSLEGGLELNYDQLLDRIDTLLIPKFNEEFFIESSRLADCLQTEFNQDLNNITLSEATVMNIVLRQIPLKKYAVICGKSYGSILGNKTRYVSLCRQKVKERSRYTVAEFEAAHFQRRNNFGKLLQMKIRQDAELNSYLTKIIIRQKQQIVNHIFNQLKKLIP